MSGRFFCRDQSGIFLWAMVILAHEAVTTCVTAILQGLSECQHPTCYGGPGHTAEAVGGSEAVYFEAALNCS